MHHLVVILVAVRWIMFLKWLWLIIHGCAQLYLLTNVQATRSDFIITGRDIISLNPRLPKVTLCKNTQHSHAGLPTRPPDITARCVSTTAWHDPVPARRPRARTQKNKHTGPVQELATMQLYNRLCFLPHDCSQVSVGRNACPKLMQASLPTHLAQGILTVLWFLSMTEDEKDDCERGSLVHRDQKERKLWLRWCDTSAKVK